MSWVLDEEVLAVISAIVLVSTVFAVVQVFNAGRVVEPFSELGLLGPDGLIGGYPKEVSVGQPFRLNVYVGNHEGRVMYYLVLVKVGDNSSTINDSSPLNADAILEIRTVLTHNSSVVVPVNVTLYEPGLNRRLVFEMWIYNETSRGFSYHGRWNQLWLNVTGSSMQSPKPLRGSMDPVLGEKVIAAYLAVRRSENSGGDVMGMVRRINEALAYVDVGRLEEAGSLLDNVLSMEADVSKAGEEAAKSRLYLMGGAVAAVSVLSLGLFLYLRRGVWLFWARFYGDYRVLWSGGDGKLNGVEKRVREIIRAGGDVRLENIVNGCRDFCEAQSAARAIYKLVRGGAIRLVDPQPPMAFGNYLRSKRNLGFMLAVAVLALSVISVYTSSLIPALAFLRYALGSIFVLFLPGYALIEALYPRGDELSPLERLALSIGLSLALVPLVGLVLNYTPWGIRLDPTVSALSILTGGLLLVSSYRKYLLYRSEASR
ncbi:MAG: DUF1616 domain-containing protein [Candidatus Bathyarchaeota archaeon]|nr:DUF1616 domain-containing protein [Candidatus Bathyarchaeota archaeon]